MYSYTVYIVLLPLFGFLLLGLLGKRMPTKMVAWTGTGISAVGALLSYITAYKYFSNGLVNGYETIYGFKRVWLRFNETLHIDMGVMLDQLSVMMLVVVSTVSLMVHLYSIAYMKGDKGYFRYFAYLSLFTFSMLGLVVATNLFQIYIFWELVGVSSFLLIGFYYTKPSAVKAAKKAFIVTRFADFMFLIGILLFGIYTNTFDFSALTSDGANLVYTSMGSLTFLGMSGITTALILLFVGGAGKSAMFPLHIWLPDAMEGPTPVSALIHAATMVVAGVFLVARMFPVYYLDSAMIEGALAGISALDIVAWVGAITSLFAALIALVQNDIKRVLAYSTMSQLGYMMLALGVSGFEGQEALGYTASMFHLFTHAMFKALLFLGAGSVIHAVHSNYLKDMGGLRKYMPITHITFLIACLAIAGIPPFAGFFSKDEILAAAFASNKLLFGIEYIVAGLTAFYMFRIYFGIFWSEDRAYDHKPKESPWAMTIPLLFLALVSIVGGFIPFGNFVSASGQAQHLHINTTLASASVFIALLGIGIAYKFYKRKNDLPEVWSNRFGSAYKWAFNKFYIDEVYEFVTQRILFDKISRPIAWFDRNVIDGSMNAIGRITKFTSEKLKFAQTGKVQDYAFGFMAGSIALIIMVLYWLGR
jgi:NADH-quinone oxidoreductase subunit L